MVASLHHISRNIVTIQSFERNMRHTAGYLPLILVTKDEISLVFDYIDYIKDNIKRLELIDNYNAKMQTANSEKKRNYYKEGMQMLFQSGENFQNYHQILHEYRDALIVRKNRINDLYNEIKIIKKLKV